MAGQVISSLDTGNLVFHDAQLDYYGKRVAAATGAPVVPEDSKPLPEGDYTVHLWDITDGQQKPLAQLKGHDGPVWKVAWAHPSFGSIVATCGYDMKVIIWKEVNNQWQKAYVDTSHTASVNDLAFCSWEHGLMLACASSDGTVSVLTYIRAEARWSRAAFNAHAGGVQSLSWAPFAAGMQLRLATGGSDNSVRIWRGEGETWTQETNLLLPAHTDWVRQVAWRPDGSSTVASGSWDKTVSIWKQEMDGQPWRQVCSLPASSKVESVAWSVTGSVLAIAGADGDSVLYKEAYDGRYEEISRCSEQGYVETAPPPQPPAAAQDFAANAAVPPPTMPEVQQQASVQDEQQQNVLEAFGM